MLTRRNLGARFAAAVSLIVLLAGPASAAHHVRGTVEAVKDGVVSVKTATGGAQEIKIGADAHFFIVAKTDLSAVNAGKFVGVTSVEKDGKSVAKEVHVFANSLRGLGEGHYPWDLGSGVSAMTNANIATVNSVGADRVLKLDYKGGEQTIEVPENTPVVAFDNCGRDQLVAGRKIFVILKKDSNDAAAAVVIGAPGVTPPM